MKAGDLVKISRASVGVPPNTIALCVGAHEGPHYQSEIFRVLLLDGRERRYLECDLEIVNESR
tara:strand:+ start:271 stop:459 length:189 start_codon:yes stop_codon:yes gene_type:complete